MILVGISFMLVRYVPFGWLPCTSPTYAQNFQQGTLATQSVVYFSNFGYEGLRMFMLVVSCIVLSLSVDFNRFCEPLSLLKESPRTHLQGPVGAYHARYVRLVYLSVSIIPLCRLLVRLTFIDYVDSFGDWA